MINIVAYFTCILGTAKKQINEKERQRLIEYTDYEGELKCTPVIWHDKKRRIFCWIDRLCFAKVFHVEGHKKTTVKAYLSMVLHAIFFVLPCPLNGASASRNT